MKKENRNYSKMIDYFTAAQYQMILGSELVHRPEAGNPCSLTTPQYKVHCSIYTVLGINSLNGVKSLLLN